jgi:putative hemolysin
LTSFVIQLAQNLISQTKNTDFAPGSEDYETLGGLIIHHLESIPEINEEIEIENYKFKVEQVSDRRIEVVNLVIKG